MDFRQSEIFLLSLSVGEGFDNIVVTKRTKKRIYLSDGNLIHIKDAGSFKYLDGKSVNHILRNIDGYLLLQIHSHDFLKTEKV